MLLKEEALTNGTGIRIYDSIRDIPAETWEGIIEHPSFYQTHRFLLAIEELHASLQFRYVLVVQGVAVKAAVYLQLLDFSYRNLVNYSGESSGGLKNGFKRYVAEKTAKLLNLGNVFFTGDKGILAREEGDIIPLLPVICNSLKNTFKTGKPSAYLVANIYLEDEAKCVDFCNSSFHPFITEPDMFLQVQDKWQSFDGYLDALSSKYRVRARKVLAVSKDILQKELTEEDIIAQKASLEKLYDNVVNHVAFNMATLNVEFFPRMKSLYGEQCKIFGYYLAGEMVGFACLFQVDPGILHVHYIGLDYTVNHSHKLYNRMLLDFVRFAIERKVSKVHFGRTATEIKSTIGAEPNPLHAYLKMNNRLMNASLPYFLKRIKPPEYTPRNPFK